MQNEVIKQKGFYKLINGECLEIMKLIPDESIDMVLCDLPYGTTACSWDVVIPFDQLWEQYKRIIKKKSAIVLFGSEPFSSKLRMSNIENYKYDWIWIKDSVTGFQTSKIRPMKKHEVISVFSYSPCASGCDNMIYIPQNTVSIKKQIKTVGKKSSILGERKNQEGKQYISNLTNFPNSVLHFGKDKARSHPTQKPVDLLEYLIRTYTEEGGVVLDNCMGTGSTGVACMNTNRKFIGIEMDEHYFKIASRRIRDAQEYKEQYGAW